MRKTLLLMILISAQSVFADWAENYPVGSDFPEISTEDQTKQVCHSFIKDGNIQYLNDCTHKLAGQTIEIPDWEMKSRCDVDVVGEPND